MLRQLVDRVHQGDVTPTDLVEEALQRIAASSSLNAVTEVFAEEALAEAKLHTRQGPLAGLPILVKDMVRVKGHRTTFGSRLFVNAPHDIDDDIALARLRAAGAIVIGRTNTPEFGSVGYTANDLYGVTRNPWGATYSPGGSSGGSAAALAAGLAPLATTSDGGGSVRAPASFCGLVGHKPTFGAIGRNYLPRWIEFSTQGATASTVDDVVLQLEVMSGPGRGDFLSLAPGSIRLQGALPRKVLAVRTFRSDVDSDVEENFERTLSALEASGIVVERTDSPTDNAAVTDWFTISSAELAQSLSSISDRANELTEYNQFNLKYGLNISLDAYLTASRRRHELSARFDDVLGDDCVIVVPTVNCRSFPAEGPLPVDVGAVVRDRTVAYNCTDASFTGHPATSVPMGLDTHGVPTGLQIIAPRFRDDLALGLARHLEMVQPWPLVAPGFSVFAP
ncbi:MAG: amidase [Acidobacteria bacterium]|nr:amidase [Acidobacteriota bacterium]